MGKKEGGVQEEGLNLKRDILLKNLGREWKTDKKMEEWKDLVIMRERLSVERLMGYIRDRQGRVKGKLAFSFPPEATKRGDD